MGVFQEHQLRILKDIYCVLYPSLSESMSSNDLILPRIYRRMNNITITGQRINSGQYVHAKPAFPDETTTEEAVSVFADPALHAAKIQHFTVHSFQSVNIIHAFALVNWTYSHPNRHLLGKPYELWCRCSVRNSFLPIDKSDI